MNLTLSSSVTATIFPLMPDQTSIWPFLLQFTTKEFRKPNLFYHVNSPWYWKTQARWTIYSTTKHSIWYHHLLYAIIHQSPSSFGAAGHHASAGYYQASLSHCLVSYVVNSHQDPWKLRPITRMESLSEDRTHDINREPFSILQNYNNTVRPDKHILGL